MVESHGPEEPDGTFYTDKDGDVWFHTECGDSNQCFGSCEDDFMKAMLRAYFAEGDE